MSTRRAHLPLGLRQESNKTLHGDAATAGRGKLGIWAYNIYEQMVPQFTTNGVVAQLARSLSHPNSPSDDEIALVTWVVTLV